MVGQNRRVVSFIDIGTSSVRLLMVRLNPNNSNIILSRQNQQVRHGEGEFEDDELKKEAINDSSWYSENLLILRGLLPPKSLLP